jgi:hypothetical protein
MQENSKQKALWWETSYNLQRRSLAVEDEEEGSKWSTLW